VSVNKRLKPVFYTCFYGKFLSKYENIIEKDGFVYEGREEYALIPYGEKSDLQRHVFIHDTANQPYKYLGKGLYEKRYDDKRNKIYFKKEKL
jgi:hypothetical protein